MKRVKQHKQQKRIDYERDPRNVIDQVKAGTINPCEMHAKKQEMMEQRSKSNKRSLKVKALTSQEDKKSRAKSVERAAIKLAFSGMTELENNHFEDLVRHTKK